MRGDAKVCKSTEKSKIEFRSRDRKSIRRSARAIGHRGSSPGRGFSRLGGGFGLRALVAFPPSAILACGLNAQGRALVGFGRWALSDTGADGKVHRWRALLQGPAGDRRVLARAVGEVLVDAEGGERPNWDAGGPNGFLANPLAV
jgi:hypothetical protein